MIGPKAGPSNFKKAFQGQCSCCNTCASRSGPLPLSSRQLPHVTWPVKRFFTTALSTPLSSHCCTQRFVGGGSGLNRTGRGGGRARPARRGACALTSVAVRPHTFKLLRRLCDDTLSALEIRWLEIRSKMPRLQPKAEEVDEIAGSTVVDVGVLQQQVNKIAAEQSHRKTWTYKETLDNAHHTATFVHYVLGIMAAYQCLSAIKEVVALAVYQCVRCPNPSRCLLSGSESCCQHFAGMSSHKSSPIRARCQTNATLQQ